MDGHHADDQEPLDGVVSTQRAQGMVMRMRMEVARREDDEDDADEHSGDGPPRAAIDALECQAGTRTQHYAGRRGIRNAESLSSTIANGEDWKSAEARRERGDERSEKDRGDADVRHVLTLTRRLAHDG